MDEARRSTTIDDARVFRPDQNVLRRAEDDAFWVGKAGSMVVAIVITI
ncbi:hypothetical protein EPIR_1286 [Erwinia piriflorinigrans CFBP 5888]|uniref:Uncharacterized protein n=1 Tax=Erwinia piriflorinigrans CFBP 5888 TaxID=1161919 RepID=V5Z5P5_9GAMM|nr:hypothetical protein EPIR_1286 [Erwinia piriflorinigrans CFBP 5888]